VKHTRSLATGWKAPLKVRPLSREPCPDPDSAASAQGVEYTRSLATGWKAPLKVRRLSEDDAQGIRDRFHIIVEGEHLPAPIIDFADMKLPPAVRATGPSGAGPAPVPAWAPSAGAGRRGARHVTEHRNGLWFADCLRSADVASVVGVRSAHACCQKKKLAYAKQRAASAR